MTRTEQISALMYRVRDALQEAIRTSPTMQTLSQESKELSIMVGIGCNILVQNLGEPANFPTEKGEEYAVPSPITDLPDWMREMKVSLDGDEREQPQPTPALDATNEQLRGVYGTGRTHPLPAGIPFLVEDMKQALATVAAIDRSKPHWHVVIETLPSREHVQTCIAESEHQAQEWMTAINKCHGVIASMPLHPCKGNCPSA